MEGAGGVDSEGGGGGRDSVRKSIKRSLMSHFFLRVTSVS